MADPFNMSDSALGDYAWSLQDEGQYQFLQRKYHDRRTLSKEATAARKLADKSETVNGQPNAHHPRLVLVADMAQVRCDMAYVMDKNRQLEEQITALSWLHQRVDILEGAYGHIKMLAETCRIDYASVLKAMKIIEAFNKEHQNAKEKPASDGGKSDVLPDKASG